MQGGSSGAGRTPDSSCLKSPAGCLNTWSCWSCDQSDHSHTQGGSSEAGSRQQATKMPPTPSHKALLMRRASGFPHESEARDLNFETQNQKPETQNPKSETLNPTPEIRNPETETRNPKPETRNPKPETRNPRPQTRNLKSDSVDWPGAGLAEGSKLFCQLEAKCPCNVDMFRVLSRETGYFRSGE